MDRGAIAVHPGPIDLRGDVQHRRAGGERLDLRARRIARRGARAGDDHAERARDARIGIRHVHRTCLAACRNEADAVVARDRVEDRHVVDRDHAEHRGDADLGQRVGDEIAHGLADRDHIR